MTDYAHSLHSAWVQYLIDVNVWEHCCIERYSSIDTTEIFAAGGLFQGDALRPVETIAGTIVFLVPRETYDFIDASIHVPSVAVAGIDL